MLASLSMHYYLKSALAGLIWSLSPLTAAADGAAWIEDAIAQICPRPNLSGLDAQAALPGAWLLSEDHRPNAAAPIRSRVTLALPDAGELHLERRARGGALWQFRLAYFEATAEGLRPAMQAIADNACRIGSARTLRYGPDPWVTLDQLEPDLTTLRWTETLQAPWPPGRDPGGVRVGFVDSGLAYDLPLFASRLARDGAGRPLGYDFWDMDPWPYDGDVSRGAFFPIRHGTTVASIFAREAPGAALVPYRYPRPDLGRMADLVAAAEAAGIRILAMPLGSRNRADWDAFAAAIANRDILVIASAGNDGVDLDAMPIYPAALDLPNLITVTSSDGFGRLARGSNWGVLHVDLMLPAENLEVTDFRGARGRASGSSYAVPRLAALAARLLAAAPDMDALALRDRIFARATRSPFERDGVLAIGWIADPLAE